MVKLATFTSLFLMGSLIILAATPTVYVFSNVLAQEYHKYGDSSYSKYPNEDKKYECQKGPFEGFFVSSVEFCKRAAPIVDRGENGIGGNETEGPQGPQGPARLLSIYTIFGPVVSSLTVERSSSIATCASGDTVLSGSYRLNQNGAYPLIVEDRALPGQNGWETTIQRNVGSNYVFNTFAQCLNNP